MTYLSSKLRWFSLAFRGQNWCSAFELKRETDKGEEAQEEATSTGLEGRGVCFFFVSFLYWEGDEWGKGETLCMGEMFFFINLCLLPPTL